MPTRFLRAPSLAAGLVTGVFACALASPAAAVPPIVTLAGGGAGTPTLGNPATSIDIGSPYGIAPAGLEQQPLLEPPVNGAYVFSRSGDCLIASVKNTDYDGFGEWFAFAGGGGIGGAGGCNAGYFSSTTIPTNQGFNNPYGLSGTVNDEVMIADDAGEAIHMVDGANLRTIAGDNVEGCTSTAPSSGDPIAANFCDLTDVSAHPTTAGRYLIAETGEERSPSGGRVYLVDGATDPVTANTRGTVSIVAGGDCTTPTNANGAELCLDTDLSVDWTTSGTGFVIAESDGRVIRMNGTSYSGSTATVLNPDAGAFVSDVAAQPDGTYLITLPNECKVRRLRLVAAVWTLEDFIGSACGAPLGEGGPPLAAGLGNARGVAANDNGIWVADTTNERIRFVPRTGIISGPPAFTNSTSATFTFDSTDFDPEFECSFNVVYDLSSKVTWNVCTSGDTFTNRPEGLNRIWIRTAYQTNPQHADDTPPIWEWTVDTTLPTEFDLVSPDDGAGGLPASPSFRWNASSDANLDRYELWIDGQKNADVTCCEAQPAGPLSETSHTWQIRAVDKAGNVRESTTRSFAAGSPPVASFLAAPNPALVGRDVDFDGSASSDESGIARFEWDLDGDGTFETDTGPTATTARAYAAPGDYTVGLRVTDAVGLTAVALKPLRINALPPTARIGVTINNGAQYTNTPDVKLTVLAPAGTSSLQVANDGGFLAARSFAPASELAWKLESSGPERLPKTVYLRFLTGTFASPNYTDDIILDERPPVVDQAALVNPPAAASAVAAARRTYKVRVKAHDSNSGVRGVYITANKRKPGTLIRYTARTRGKRKILRVRSTRRPRFIRARDLAGNRSRWKKLR